MVLSLRKRIFLTLVPSLLLLIVLGSAGVVLLHRLGGRIDLILRENYDSVIAMERLHEALERIDSAFQFSLVGHEAAKRQYDQNWQLYREALHLEENNVTLPGEQDLVNDLVRLSNDYRGRGEAFFKRPAQSVERRHDYFGPNGLLQQFEVIKQTASEIQRINQENMKEESRHARETARESMIWFGIGLMLAVILAAVSARQTVRTLLRPIEAVTQSALAIGHGNLDQVVPVLGRGELEQLADAFNTMARQLRGYRQSYQAQMLRLQKTTQAAIDSFPDPVLVVDPEGQVELANPAARRALGVPSPPAPPPRVQGRGEHVGSSAGGPGLAVPWQPPDPLRTPLREALREQRAYLPQGLDGAIPLLVGGEERFFLPRILPIQDAENLTLGAAVLLEDVTRFRLLDEVKSNLVATVSHELKTPLTSIRLAIHLLLEESQGPLASKQLELLLDARDNTERLLAMIENLLDLARLQQGGKGLDLGHEAPAELLRVAAEAFGPRAQDKGLELVVTAAPDLPNIEVDARHLGHALDNLLENALRYTNRGGRILLSAGTSAGRVTLSVTDTGAGIPSEYLPHVFNRFFRVPRQSQEPGTGLGLAIVHEIVTAHSGTVSVESQVGKGTTFCLSLPASPGE